MSKADKFKTLDHYGPEFCLLTYLLIYVYISNINNKIVF